MDPEKQPERQLVVPAWAKVSPQQVEEARRLGVPVAYEEEVVGMRFVLIPGGTFLMGSPEGEPGREPHEGPQHEVRVEPFYMGVHPVSVGQYFVLDRIANRSPFGGDEPEEGEEDEPPYGDSPEHPMTEVSWMSAFDAARALGVGLGYGLPSEERWEYACRAGSTTRWCFGDDEARLDDYAWYRPSYAGMQRWDHCPQPSGAKLPNAWGLYDMHGNVAEWCADDWRSSYAPEPPAPPAPPAAQRRGSRRKARPAVEDDECPGAVRGCSQWNDPAHRTRSAARFRVDKCGTYDAVGFRVVRALPRPG